MMTRILLFFCLCLPYHAWCQDKALEIQVKAAFLYKFCQYVQWPEDKSAKPTKPIIIGVAYADLISEELKKAVVGRQINGHPIEVHLVEVGTPIQELHMLFAGSNSLGLKVLLEHKDWPILTVTEQIENSQVGMINFVVENNRVRFDISQELAQQAGLKLSSQLLSVARHVKRGGD